MKLFLKRYVFVQALFLVLVLGGNLLHSPTAYAGVCTTVTLLRDSKVVSQNGSFSIPHKDKSKYQIKLVVKAGCQNTHTRAGLIFIDQQNKSQPVNYILPSTVIPKAGLTKTFNFVTTGTEGVYNYNFETYNIKGADINLADGAVNSDGLRITLGEAAKASTGNLSSDGKPANTDYKTPGARPYAGVGWEGTLQILNPLNSNGEPVTDVSQLATKLINWLLLILGLIATAVIVYAGILLVFNGGNEAQVKKAKTILTWAIIGLVVSLSAFAIVNMIQVLLG